MHDLYFCINSERLSECNLLSIVSCEFFCLSQYLEVLLSHQSHCYSEWLRHTPILSLAQFLLYPLYFEYMF